MQRLSSAPLLCLPLLEKVAPECCHWVLARELLQAILILLWFFLAGSCVLNFLHYWGAALFLAWLASATMMLSSTALQWPLGKRGLIAMERLVAIAMQMFLDGVRSYWAVRTGRT